MVYGQKRRQTPMVLSVTMCHSLILDQIKAVKDALCSEQQLDDACEPHALFEHRKCSVQGYFQRVCVCPSHYVVTRFF